MKLRDLSLLLALIAIAAYFTWQLRDPAAGHVFQNNRFISSVTLSQLVVEVSISAMLAVGMLLVILPGHIDLSAGSGVGLFGGLATVLLNGSGWLTQWIGDFHKWLGASFGAGAAAWFYPPPWPDPVAMGVALVVAMLFWAMMGTLIVRGGVQAFIITLGGMLVFKGLFWRVIESKTIAVAGPATGKVWHFSTGDFFFDVPQDWMRRLTTDYLSAETGLLVAGIVAGLMFLFELRAWARRRKLGMPGDDFELVLVKWLIAAQLVLLFVIAMNQSKGVPLPAVMLAAVALAVHVLTRHTRFGRHLYAIGGNEEAAVVSGINVRRVVVGAFMLMGAIVAITGFMQASYTGATTTSIGGLMELDAVAACVIGGVSLKGGRGTVMGVFLGALIMATLAKGMSLAGADPEDKFMVLGAVLVLAVLVDTRLRRFQGQ